MNYLKSNFIQMKTTPKIIFLLLFIYSSCSKMHKEIKVMPYPAAKKEDVSDDYFGTRITDPYRWLENDTAADVKKWGKDENAVTENYLSQIPFRDKIKTRLSEIWNYENYSSPFQKGDYFFFYKNDGLQNQSVLYYQKGLDGKAEVFIDPNLLSKDGTTALGAVTFSKDHQYMAYSVANAGSDWNTIYVMEVASRKKLEDRIDWVKFSGAVWCGNGFYYSRYDEPAKGKEYSNQNQFQKVYYHKIGDPQSKDVLVFEDKQHPLRYFGADVTQDERFVFISASEGTYGTEIYYKDIKSGDKSFNLLFKGFDHEYSIIDNEEGNLLVYTDHGAAKRRLILVDPKHGDEKNWKDIIPEGKDFLESVSAAGGKLFATYLKDVSSIVFQLDRSGKGEREIKLPGIGTVTGFGGEKDDKILFYTFTSFIYPPTIFKYDIASGKSDVFRKPNVKFNPDDYETKQVFYPSKDGTKIPMFIIHKKGIILDGKNPAFLYAYGGFNVNITPSWSISRVLFLENGGVYAVPNLRGGGEYGEEWHKGGMLEKKQNVFDDFIAAGEFLIKEKYTSSEKLAISGRSNGGLLVGACMTQRPDLFKVALPGVGVLDMLRYHKFTIGWGWAVEYGSSDKKEQFDYLVKYSPLHNVKENTTYPATLITTADHDDRVVPAHSFKFAATLQEKNKGNNPVLIRIDSNAGHGAGKPTAKLIDENTDIWSFVFWNLGMTM